MTESERIEIEKIYLEMFHVLFEYSNSNLKNEELAEKAIHEVFRRICQRPEEFINCNNRQEQLISRLKHEISRMQEN